MDETTRRQDAAIVSRVVEGDTEAFAELVRRYHGKVYQLCYGMMGTADRAEDAAQEVFIKAFRRLASFRGESAFSTWLYRLASNQCLDLLRSRARQRTDSWDHLLETQGERVEALLQAGPGPGGPTEDLRETIDALLSELKPDYRLVLTLREIQVMSY